MTRATLRRLSVAALTAALLIDTVAVISGPTPFSELTTVVSEINTVGINGHSTGGRIHHLAVNAAGTAFYAASEWGGLYKSVDGGDTWTRLDGYEPQATWDVAVDGQKVYATSFYDGRIDSVGGLSISHDSGATWQLAAVPPPEFNCHPSLQPEPSAFGISIDPADTNHVWVGTNCGPAKSTDGGATWTFYKPTFAGLNETVWDVVVHNGIVDIVSGEGHRRTTDGGATWTAPSGFPLPSADLASLAVSPYEDHVLFATAGTTVYESNDGGASWKMISNVPGDSQGRIPFVKVNDRGRGTYDLWFGDVGLRRTSCTTPDPPLPGGTGRCNYSGWSGNLTAGAHADVGDIIFDPQTLVSACPLLFANDGGVHVNTIATSPACHSPVWTNPTQSPRALWAYAVELVPANPHSPLTLVLGTQDNGAISSDDFGAFSPSWSAAMGQVDVFDLVANPKRLVVARNDAAGNTVLQILTPPADSTTPPLPDGKLAGFVYGDVVEEWALDRYIVVTSTGAYTTDDIETAQIAWTQLGANTYPAKSATHTVRVSHAAQPWFFVQVGGNLTFSADQLWQFQGTSASGTWQQVPPPPGGDGFTVVGVHPSVPSTIIAGHTGPAGSGISKTTNGGATWAPLSQLTALVTRNGEFHYRNRFGPKLWQSRGGYPQPTLVAFDPKKPNLVLAGASETGLFLSTDGGDAWGRIENPVWFIDGTPHVTRPHAAVFNNPLFSLVSVTSEAFVATRGRGVFRVRIKVPAPNVFDICKVDLTLCSPIPKEEPNLFTLRPLGERVLQVSSLVDHCPLQSACLACERDGCGFLNVFLDGFDASTWDVGVVDGAGASIPHRLSRTARGVVVSLEASAGIFSRAHLVFAQRSGAPAGELRIRSLLEITDRPWVPASLEDVVF